jgi:hypothetical protein
MQRFSGATRCPECDLILSAALGDRAKAFRKDIDRAVRAGLSSVMDGDFVGGKLAVFCLEAAPCGMVRIGTIF